MTEPELKPCPRCGGRAKGVSDADDEHLVSCSVCGLSDSSSWPTEAEAAAWWNERPAEQAKAEPKWSRLCTCDKCMGTEPEAKQAAPPEPDEDDHDGYPCSAEGTKAEREGEPEPARAEPVPHKCPYDGVYRGPSWFGPHCGVDGWLCDRCKADALERFATRINTLQAGIVQAISDRKEASDDS